MSISNSLVSSKYRISRQQGQGFLDNKVDKNQQFLDPLGTGFLYHAEMEIKDWIKTAREHSKLTQEQLGERMGKTKGNISAWENGRHEASFTQLQQISAITGYPMPSANEMPGQHASNEQNVITELKAIAEIAGIYSRCSPERRRRLLNAARDIERMLDIGVKPRGATNHKP